MINAFDTFIKKEKKEKMTFEEFIDLFNKTEKIETKEDIKELFDSFADEKNPNIISFDSLKKIVIELGENMTDEEIKDLILTNSKQKKLELTFEKFYQIMLK